MGMIVFSPRFVERELRTFEEMELEIVNVANQDAARLLEAALWGAPGLFALVYGSSDALDAMLQLWREQGIPLHNIVVVSHYQIPGADAAYDISTDTIELSDAFVSSAGHERLVDAIVEELGHRLDAALGGDTAGDEGQALVAVLRGEPVPVTEEDSSKETGLEYSTTVSDSGGFEGSSKILLLESKAGSKITYYYEHYSIPDRFIIRYEGLNLIDTGFKGGSASGTVNLPAGKADKAEVIVATDNAGTAWLYTVSAEPLECEDVRPWTITADSKFKHNDKTDKCETTGTIYVGRTEGAARLIRASGTTAAAYRKGLLEVKAGQIYSGIGGISERLFTADFSLNLNNGIASLSEITQGDFKLAGLPVEFKSMSLLSDMLAFDVRFKMPDAASGLLIETADFYSQALRIKSGGAYPVRGFRIDPPAKKEFKLGGLIDVKASNMAIEYRAGEDALRLQAKVEFENTNFAKTKKGIGSVEADLSGPNYIQVDSDGKVDIIGVLKATSAIKLDGGWSIKGLEFNINTTTREVGGAGTLGTPFGVQFGEGATARAELEFLYDPFQLDKIGLTLDNLNKPISAYPAFFIQSIGGSVNNFAPSNNNDVEGKLTIGATLGPKIAGNSLALAQFDATVTSKSFDGQMTTDLLTADFSLVTQFFTTKLGKFTLVKDVSTAKLDWSKGELSFTGTSNVLDGFVVTTGSFKANSKFDFSFARSAQISLPNFVPVYGGTMLTNANFAINYTNNSTYADDYAAGWGQKNVVTPWDQYNITLGLRINFDGSIARIGSGNIPTTSSWFVSGGKEYVMLTAGWETDTQGIKVRVIKPDGTVIEEGDFATNRIAIVDDFSSGTSRTVIIDAPEEGTWDLEITDTTGLGTVYYEATGAVELPKFTFTGKPIVNADGSVTYNFDATTTTSITYLNFYYDDDLSELNGLLAGSVALMPTDSSGTFIWDAAQVVPGSYFLYAMVDNVSGPIVIVENSNAVTVGSEADLSVTLEADMEEANAGDKVELTISVANLSANTKAKGAKAYVNLPADVTVLSATSPLKLSEFAQFEITLGDIAAGATQTATINVVVDAGAKPGDQFTSDVYVLADTYDSETENDGDVVQFIVPAEPAPTTVNLTVDSKIHQAIAPTVNLAFTYMVTVSNTGTRNATSVVLTETVQGLRSMSANLPSNFNGKELVVVIGNLAAGHSVDVAITALAPVAGLAFTTSAVVADGVDSAIIDNEQVNIAEILGVRPDMVDLSLTFAHDLNNTITLAVRNDGPGIASDVEIQFRLPAGALVISSNADQGSYDDVTGVWSVGNIRDKLTRTLTLSVIGLSGGKITAEVVGVNELDTDSTPNDREGDDFAFLSGLYTSLSGMITGTLGDDILYAAGTDDSIDALGGNDIVRPGGGTDTVTIGTGADQIIGSPGDLDGDTVTDLEQSDTLVFTNVSFDNGDVTVIAGPPPALQIDTDADGNTDTTIMLGRLPGEGVYVWQRGTDTRLTFLDYLVNVEEGKSLAAGDINWISNRDILTGDGSTTFKVNMDQRAAAAFSNTIGVYEIDDMGLIRDVRILLNDVGETSGSDLITGVEARHTLGFFIIADGKNFANKLRNTDTLTFLDRNNAAANADGGVGLFLAVNGTTQSLNVFHSHAAALNPDGLQHAISGLSASGNKLIFGFEDLFGGGDRDYQDVLFSIDFL
jgi:hypothetical protein